MLVGYKACAINCAVIRTVGLFNAVRMGGDALYLQHEASSDAPPGTRADRRTKDIRRRAEGAKEEGQAGRVGYRGPAAVRLRDEPVVSLL